MIFKDWFVLIFKVWLLIVRVLIFGIFCNDWFSVSYCCEDSWLDNSKLLDCKLIFSVGMFVMSWFVFCCIIVGFIDK